MVKVRKSLQENLFVIHVTRNTSLSVEILKMRKTDASEAFHVSKMKAGVLHWSGMMDVAVKQMGRSHEKTFISAQNRDISRWFMHICRVQRFESFKRQ